MSRPRFSPRPGPPTNTAGAGAAGGHPGRWPVALLVLVLLAPAAALTQQRPAHLVWSTKVADLERELERLGCLDVIDEGQHLDMRYLTSEDIDLCRHIQVEEILADDEVYVEHLWCLGVWADLNAAKARQRGAQGVEDAFEEVTNPIPDSPKDLLRKAGTALDIATVLGAKLGEASWNQQADGYAAEAERYRFLYFQRRAALDGLRDRWERRKLIQPDCPPKPRPRPDPTPEPPPKPPKPPAPPKPPPPPIDGRQLYRCDMDVQDPLLGHLVYCTEYDSDRIGSLPTRSQLDMSESICTQAGGVWSAGPCRDGWAKRCVTRKGAAHFYYQFVADAPEQQCRRWKGELTEGH